MEEVQPLPCLRWHHFEDPRCVNNLKVTEAKRICAMKHTEEFHHNGIPNNRGEKYDEQNEAVKRETLFEATHTRNSLPSVREYTGHNGGGEGWGGALVAVISNSLLLLKRAESFCWRRQTRDLLSAPSLHSIILNFTLKIFRTQISCYVLQHTKVKTLESCRYSVMHLKMQLLVQGLDV